MTLVVLVASSVNCAITLHDPLIAINYHTGYPLRRGAASQTAMSAPAYVRQNHARALTTTDTDMACSAAVRHEVDRLEALPGMAAPFVLERGSPDVGLVPPPAVPHDPGDVPAVCHHLNIGGGSEGASPCTPIRSTWWRPAMRWCVCPLAVHLARTRPAGSHACASAVRAAAATVAVLAYRASHDAVAGRGRRRGQDLTVGAGPRDLTFFRRDWSPPQTEGLATVRVSLTERAVVWLPLPSVRAYDVVLRFDQVSPELQHRVSVLLNRQLIAQVGLGWDPQRAGSYRIRLPEEQVKAGANELMLIPDVMVPRAAAGPRFAWVQSGDRLGVRLWYVRVLGG